MRRTAIIIIATAFLVHCGGNKPTPEEVAIPVPAEKNTIEPSVAQLLNKTGSELHAAMDDPKRWMTHGSALFANAYYNEAIQAYEQAIALNREMPQATYMLATAYWKANKQQEAVQTLESALQLIPQYDMGWRLLAEWQLDRGETEKAIQSARRAFELNPARIGTRYILAQSLMDQGSYDEAIPFLEEAIERDKAPRWIYSLAGQCYRQVGNVEKAEQAMAQAGPPFEDWPDPMYNHIPNLIAGKSELALYALHLHSTQGPEKALPFLLKANKIAPEHSNVRVALSIALQKKGQLEKAQQVLDALQGEPNVNYWKQYAGLMIALETLEQAKEYIHNAIQLNPEDANAHDIAAVIAKKQGDKEEAVAQWTRAGQLYVQSEQWKKAELSLAFASDEGALHLDGLEALATSQFEMGNSAQANTTVQKILQKDPTNPIALELESRLSQE